MSCRFVELLCIKSEIPLANTDSAVEEVVKVKLATGTTDPRQTCLADWQTGGLADWQNGRLAKWQTGRLADWQTGKMADWQTGTTDPGKHALQTGRPTASR